MSQSKTIPLLDAAHELRTARCISHLAAISEVTDMLTTEKLPPAFALVDGGTLREIEPRGWWRGLGDYPRSSAFSLMIDGEPCLIPATEISLDRAAWQRALELIRATAAEQPAKVAELVNARANAEFQSPDWSLGNVLSWIAFRDPALICRLDDLRQLRGYRRYKESDPQPFVEDGEKAYADLLAALKIDGLRAIKDGAEVESIYWYGKQVRNLSDIFRFRRSEVLKRWPALSGGWPAAPQTSRPSLPRAAGLARYASGAANQQAKAARERTRRHDEKRPEIVLAVGALCTTEEWKNTPNGVRCGLVEKYLGKPNGWCTLRTFGRAYSQWEREP